MKLSELLNLAKESSMPDKEKIRKKALKRYHGTAVRILSGVTAAVLILAILSGGAYFGIMNIPTASASDLPSELENISPISSVKATSVSGSEITTDTNFKITTGKVMSVETLREALEIKPSTKYNIKKDSGNSFTVSFENGLEADTLYTVSSKSSGKTIYSWAFQTDNIFRILSRSPESDSIEKNGKVSIDFTHSNVENFEECFSIYPAIPGTFEHYGRRWVFIPSDEFEADTLYTVTINKNITGGDSEKLENDYSFSFIVVDPDSQIYVSYQTNNLADSFLSSQVPAARLEYWNTNISEADVTVYQIPDAQAYIDIHKSYLHRNFVSSLITDKLSLYTKVIDFTADPAKSSNSYSGYNAAYIQYPRKFETGYYISEIKFTDKTLYHVFQITELVVYTVTSNGDYTVWVNSSKTKSPTAGAVIELDGFDPKTTDENGLAVFTGGKTNDCENIILKVSNGSEKEYIASLIPTYEDENSKSVLDYYSYLYTDSEIYNPTDKINVWGFVLPRTGDAETPSSVKLYSEWNDVYTDISLNENGSFTTQLELSGTCTDEYSSVTVLYNNQSIVSTEFYVQDYTLPTYTLDIASDKNAYFNGEKISYTVSASLFDGTPAANVKIQTEINGKTKEITTDENGIAGFNTTADYYKDSNYPDNNSPSIMTASFTVVDSDGTSNVYYNSNAVFDADIAIKFTNTESAIESDIYKVSLDMLNSMHLPNNGNEILEIASDIQNYISESYDSDVTAELHKVTYEKAVSGTAYNPVTMTVENSYSYDSVDNIVSTKKINSKDGKLSLDLPQIDSETDSYYYLLYADGTNGSRLCAQYCISQYNDPDNFTYILTSDKDAYTPGDTVKLKLTDISNGAQVENGTLLVSGINADIITNNVFGEPADASVEYSRLFSPDVCIAGAYFDGESVHLVQTLRLSSEKQELNIDIKTNKENYAPGDDVILDLTVYDSQNRPVKADVNISVIDAKLKEMFIEKTDIYEQVYFPRLYLSEVKRTVSSYMPVFINESNYGEGGIGIEHAKSDFDLSPCFETLTTDSNGTAHVEFRLPDSIAGWNITAQAFTSDAKVGMSEITVLATKDFYISVPTDNKIKTSDDAVFPIKFTAKNVREQCKYSAKLSSDGIVIYTKDGTSDINSIVVQNFGKLDSGKYTLEIFSECGQLSDTLVFEFTVSDTYSYEYITKRFQAESVIKTDNDFTSDVTVNIYDEEYDFYFTVLEKLSDSCGNRLEQAIGRYIAGIHADGENDLLSSENLAELSAYQTPDGLRIFKDGNYITPEISAKATAAAGEYFNKSNQLLYYRQIIESTPATTQALAAYWGLASLGAPVLNDLNSLNGNIDSLTEEEILYLALAYAYAGDYKSARGIYDSYIAGKIKSANGISEYSADTAYETENLTGLVAILSSKISAPQTKELVKYILLCDNLTAARGIVLSAFLNSFVPYLEGKNQVEITYADGHKQKIEYARTGSAVIKLPYNDIEKTVFTPIKGTSIMTVFGNTPTNTILSQYRDISQQIDFSVNIDDDPKVGSLTEIHITAEIPEEYSNDSVISLTLPYSLKVISGKSSNGGYRITSYSDILKMYPNNGKLDITITCYVSVDGEFTFEPMTFINKEKAVFASAPAYVISPTAP